MWNLKGQTALVTGGSKGIGKAVVQELLSLGAEVAFTARTAEDVLALEDELSTQGYKIKGMAADVTEVDDRRKVLEWMDANWKALTILVNNAGMNIRKKALDYSDDEFRKVLELNLMAPFILAREVHHMMKKAHKGKIINIASAAATQDVGTGTPYAMSKAALLQQTRSLAVEWASDGIRVNAVSPWFTRTPLTDGYLQQDDKRNAILGGTPMNRVAEPEEIAAIVAFLAMDKSSFITGQNIVADGGMSIKAI